MKKRFYIPHSFIFILIIVALVSLSIAVINPNHEPQDEPPTESADLKLEVGSTNGITVLAFIISGVIILPLITSGALKRKPPFSQE